MLGRGPPNGKSEYTSSNGDDRSEGDVVVNEDLESELGVPDLGSRSMRRSRHATHQLATSTGARKTGQLMFVWCYFLPSN